MNKTMKTILAILAGGLLLCQQAQAAPITGAVEFSGSATASGPSGPPDTIHFLDPWHTVAGIGSYAAVPFGTATTFGDFTFIGDGSAATLVLPDIPAWTFTIGATTYSFDLLALTNGHVDAGSMAFTGTGIAHITGFADTPASFALQGAGSGFDFTLSSSTTATIPEGSTTALLILGLVLVGIVTLRQRRAA
ncbi:MAG TPA: PEP-CTERM sorting domain-containing protein [Chthoniobacterales bacterium]|jgi:hypothetical protein|nr:PEP-CTERM sorting domain-containing protein [Chthoniobacterales bacterium]